MHDILPIDLGCTFKGHWFAKNARNMRKLKDMLYRIVYMLVAYG